MVSCMEVITFWILFLKKRKSKNYSMTSMMFDIQED